MRIRAQNSTVTGIIDRMEREGLVVRERSTEDRRVVHIRLTDEGREARARHSRRADGDLPRARSRASRATETRELLQDPHEDQRGSVREAHRAARRRRSDGTRGMTDD